MGILLWKKRDKKEFRCEKCGYQFRSSQRNPDCPECLKVYKRRAAVIHDYWFN